MQRGNGLPKRGAVLVLGLFTGQQYQTEGAGRSVYFIILKPGLKKARV